MSLHAALMAAAAVLIATPAASQAVKPDPAVVKALAPSGKLRAAINVGNSVLVQRNPKTGELQGVEVRLAKELAKALGVPLEMVSYPDAATVADAASKDQWNVGFLAPDPKRAETIIFTQPYVLMEGAYLVRADSPYRTSDDLDRDGVRIGVGRGTAYDLYLSRVLKHAVLVRTPTPQSAIDQFAVDKNLDAATGGGVVLDAYVKTRPGLRVIHPGFQTMEQCIAVPKDEEAAIPFVRAFLERMKTSGFVRKGLDETGQTSTAVAPPSAD